VKSFDKVPELIGPNYIYITNIYWPALQP